jgi:hypothetical protein
MLEVLVKDRRGVACVVDQDTVGALGSDTAYKTFGITFSLGGVRGGVVAMSMPSLANTASKAVVNLVSVSYEHGEEFGVSLPPAGGNLGCRVSDLGLTSGGGSRR